MDWCIILHYVRNTFVVCVAIQSCHGVREGEPVLIPRISFIHTLPSGHTLLRRQFPLAAAYTTTFHSCQGLTLDRVGIDLTCPLFAHGQLYTAVSCVQTVAYACLQRASP